VPPVPTPRSFGAGGKLPAFFLIFYSGLRVITPQNDLLKMKKKIELEVRLIISFELNAFIPLLLKKIIVI
jgi:hypothetical protein